MARLLVVEDEAAIRRFLELELRHEGHEVECVGDGRIGLEKAMEGGWDAAVLDILLPGLNGIEVCRRLRAEGSSLPLLLLTAKDEVADKIAGLDVGADDYLTKPFAIEELLARVRALLRRSQVHAGEEEVLRVGALEVRPASRTVAVGGSPIQLTKTEYDLLEHLVRNSGVVLTRDAILRDVWGYDYEGDSNLVDVYVRYLRAKLGEKLIHTVRGVGYVLREDERDGERDGEHDGECERKGEREDEREDEWPEVD